MKKIEKFSIFDLFGEYDVAMDLKNEVKIYVGENGLGKTTILNCLYCVLSGQINKLLEIDFKKIEIMFEGDSQKYTIDRSDLLKSMKSSKGLDFTFCNPDFLFKLSPSEMQKLSTLSVDEVYQLAKNRNFTNAEMMMLLRAISSRDSLFGDMNGSKKNKTSRCLQELRRAYSDVEILYFPTYRRIEEDLVKLGGKSDETYFHNNLLIQFGMHDVEKAIENILKTINKNAVDGFTQMTGLLLKQYLDGEKLVGDFNSTEMRIDNEELNIALDRIGNQISENDKAKIKELVNSNDIYDLNNKHLLNLIRQLILSYEKQKIYDEKIKKFRDVCNGFLVGKQFVYDESQLKLEILKTNTGRTVDLSKLSSGEKQVLSVFSKLYLEEDKQFVILFDEPELSLSMKWQSHFLTDIFESGMCKQLIAVTHSPFIFDNKFDQFAEDMNNCISEAARE
ncbi:MAG: AAA family ATPase [Butyrivibrio sp.]|nr:AAA family ATPase [Butyrivibrio sp.]